MVAPVSLVASSDDFLVEEALRERVLAVCAEFGNVEPEFMPDEITPEDLSVELCSPSLFAPQRVLVVSEASHWLDIPARRPSQARPTQKAAVDASAVVQVLSDGLPGGIALVMGACCRSQPKGKLADAVSKAGETLWYPVPPPPKPWEDAVLSLEQEAMLRQLLEKTTEGIRFTPEASRLLLDRLGFAPRLLVQEGRKLAAANVGGVVDEDLVKALSFPKERSLDVVESGVLTRRAAPVLDLIAAAEAGIQIRDRQGRAVSSKGVLIALFSQVSALLQKFLYLRRLAADHGLLEEMSLDRTRADGWYPRKFQKNVGPKILDLLNEDGPSPVLEGHGRAPSLYALGKIFKGAGLYSDDELRDALADLGSVEVALRGEMASEALSVWLVSFLRRA
jgi:hypothetical protein